MDIALEENLNYPEVEGNYLYSWSIDYYIDGVYEVESEESNSAVFSLETEELLYGDEVLVSLLIKDDGGAQCELIATYVMAAKQVPLGSFYTTLDDECFFKVYVPTKYGGNLSVSLQSTDGELKNIKRPFSDEVITNFDSSHLIGVDWPSPNDLNGWYYFSVSGASLPGYEVSNSFMQEMSSTKRPWNFYYWTNLQGLPDKPTLYGTTGTYTPLQDYDLILGTQARQEEENQFVTNVIVNGSFYDQISLFYANCNPVEDGNVYEVESWHGHCLGATVASILHEQPDPETQYPNLSAEELEGLYAEIYEGQYFGGVEGYADNLTSISPPSNLADVADIYCGLFHKLLEQRVGGQKLPLYTNLRKEPTIMNPTPEDSEAAEFWNHAVFSFEATYNEAILLDDEGNSVSNKNVVNIMVSIHANFDGEPPTEADTAERVIEYVYQIEYDSTGKPVVEINPNTGLPLPSDHNNWISVGGAGYFHPGNVTVINEFSFPFDTPTPCNSEITLELVKSLDNAND